MKFFRRKSVFPSIADQEAIIVYLKQSTEADLVARFKADKEFRYTADAVFGCWRIRSQCRIIRLQRGYTQEELGRRAGMSQPQIARIENIYAPCDLTIQTLQRIAHALDVALICKFTSWGELIRDIVDTMSGKLGLSVPSFNEEFPSTVGEK